MTKDPKSHPELHIFLQRIIGFDSVDDESKPERRTYKKFPSAKNWNVRDSPPYSYWYVHPFLHLGTSVIWVADHPFRCFSP